MDPLNPIVPTQSLIGRIPPTPGLPRVSPEQQRRQPRDDQPGQDERDQEDEFQELLEETDDEQIVGDGAVVQLTASEEFFIPEVTRVKPAPPAEPPGASRRAADLGVDDDEPESHHIDISA